MKKDEVIEALKSQPKVQITFEKADGSMRDMVATLNQDVLPPAPEPVEGEEPKKPRAQNPDVQPVYDMIAEGWRSFKWAALKTVDGKEYVGEENEGSK